MTLPVINHLTGFTISQEPQAGALITKGDGNTITINHGVKSSLAAKGFTIDITGNTATLKVDMSNNDYYGGNLVVTI